MPFLPKDFPIFCRKLCEGAVFYYVLQHLLCVIIQRHKISEEWNCGWNFWKVNFLLIVRKLDCCNIKKNNMMLLFPKTNANGWMHESYISTWRYYPKRSWGLEQVLVVFVSTPLARTEECSFLELVVCIIMNPRRINFVSKTFKHNILKSCRFRDKDYYPLKLKHCMLAQPSSITSKASFFSSWGFLPHKVKTSRHSRGKMQRGKYSKLTQESYIKDVKKRLLSVLDGVMCPVLVFTRGVLP